MSDNKAFYTSLFWFLTCSNCGNVMTYADDEGTPIPTNFCPNCGAKITKIVSEKDPSIIIEIKEE